MDQAELNRLVEEAKIRRKQAIKEEDRMAEEKETRRINQLANDYLRRTGRTEMKP